MPSPPTHHSAEPCASPGLATTTSQGLLRPIRAFTPFVAVSLVHLSFLLIEHSAASTVSTWLLVPTLMAAVLLASPARRAVSTMLLMGALVFSWLGDVILSTAGAIFFVLGLGVFLLAHLGYLAVFVCGLGLTRPRRWAFVYLAWWVAFLIVLAPHLGALFLPVAVYGAVVAAMAAYASRGGGVLAVGGALFLVSDTMLGAHRFLPGFDLGQIDFFIMLAYLAGQGLIVWAVIRTQSGAGGGRVHPVASMRAPEPVMAQTQAQSQSQSQESPQLQPQPQTQPHSASQKER